MLEIYTDGGCSGNPGPGGWAYVIIGTREWGVGSGEEEPCLLAEKWGAEKSTTNNRMELQAVIAALEALPSIDAKPEKLTIYTDSQYVQKGITLWIKDWKSKGWKTADKKPVKNQDLWQRLDALASAMISANVTANATASADTGGFSINWVWIKGHAGNEYNERCDELTQTAIASLQ